MRRWHLHSMCSYPDWGSGTFQIHLGLIFICRFFRTCWRSEIKDNISTLPYTASELQTQGLSPKTPLRSDSTVREHSDDSQESAHRWRSAPLHRHLAPPPSPSNLRAANLLWNLKNLICQNVSIICSITVQVGGQGPEAQEEVGVGGDRGCGVGWGGGGGGVDVLQDQGSCSQMGRRSCD